MARFHGKGYYKVTKHLIVPDPEKQSVKVEETWLIQNERNFLVQFKEKGNPLVKGAFLYKGRKAYHLNEEGKLKTRILSPNFFEKFFLFREVASAKKFLFRHGIIPQKALIELEEDQEKPSEDSFLRLSRRKEGVHYEIGTSSRRKKPKAWVKKDAFTLTSIRLKDLSEITASNYKNYGLFWFPKFYGVSWGDKKVLIKNISVKRFYSKNRSAHFKLSHLYKKSLRTTLSKASENLKEFYKKFR